MAIIIIILSFFVTFYQIQSAFFCSAVCKANSCSGPLPTDCSNCDAPFMLSGTTCIINPASGWSQIDTSIDLGGGGTLDLGASTNCGIYSFFGNYTKTDSIVLTFANGITSPYYQIQLIYWLTYMDSVSGGVQISTTLNQASLTVLKSRSSTRVNTFNVCGNSGNNQDYCKIVTTYNFNQTNIPLTFTIAQVNNTQNDPWGVKQFQLLAKLCNVACWSCWSNLASTCWSCNTDLAMLLNNNTCNQSCLAGFGTTSDGMTCVWCNLRCSVCVQTMDNCLACTTSGIWKSYLVVQNSTCVGTCPDGYFANTTSFTCDLCNPNCSTCKFNSNYCLSCISGFGWNSYSCYNPCPIGTFTDLTISANTSINCTRCSLFCIQCVGPSTNCLSCTISGTYIAYLLNSTCYRICPSGFYGENYNFTGPNQCLGCDISCATCMGNPSPCLTCNPGFYLFNSLCGTTCNEPTYFPDNNTWQCLACDQYCVGLNISFYCPNSLNLQMYIDMNFTEDLDFTTFSMDTFQTISTDSTMINMGMFDISYVQTGARSYRIILQPKGYIFLYNVTFTVTTMIQPTPVHYSINGRPFKSLDYSLSANQKWFLVKAPGMTQTQQSVIDGLSKINDKISWFTTLPFVQQVKKTGIFNLLMGGAQITSCSVLVNSVPSQNLYEGVRFWAMFVFFDVPQWQKNSNKTKYIIVPPQNEIVQNSRLLNQNVHQRALFDTSNIQWRFQRTGHSSFFIFDCYMNIILIIICWVLVLVGQCIIKKKKELKQYMGKFYSLLHKVHQVSILYISLTTLLQWIYFESTSVQRWISLLFCLIFNLYFLGYELYIYYDMLKYPKAEIGNEQYQYYLIRYGSFLKNIRYQQYDVNQQWSPKQWFRPYNYHFISYYKKLMMMVSLPLFYESNNFQIYVLIFLQILQILRFCFTWPFKTKSRNVIRLVLQFVLLAFFVTVAIQGFLIQNIMTLDPITQGSQLQSQISVYYYVGWIGFVLVFLFNFSFVFIWIFDLCLGFKKSNRQLMDQARRNFYMQKLRNYQQQNQQIHLGMLNKWVKKGNLNKRNFQELPDINLRVQCYKITKCDSGYTIDMKKILEIFMSIQFNFNQQNNTTVGKKMNKKFLLTNSLSSQFFKLIDNLYKSYSQKYSFESMAIKTFQKIEQSEYNAGDKIRLNKQLMNQKLQFYSYNNQTKSIKLDNILEGFPINQDDLKVLQRKI